jgi:hypothetical protein
MDPETHKRFLDYRARHVYFGAKKALLGADAFVAADAEQRALEARGEARTPQEEARFAELSATLFRD